jgi:hypothetical protein
LNGDTFCTRLILLVTSAHEISNQKIESKHQTSQSFWQTTYMHFLA